MSNQHHIILAPQLDSWWQSSKVYNPAVFKVADEYQLLYRAVGADGISRLGLATSSDGLAFTVKPGPMLVPESELESRGLEDPRAVKIGDRYLLTYTAYDGVTARLALAESEDALEWRRFGPVLVDWDWTASGGFLVGADPARFNPSADWSKEGAIFDRLYQGQYWMVFGDSCLWLASARELSSWQGSSEPLLKPRPGYFDNYYLEMGPAPLWTNRGWLVFYHGVSHDMVYSLGAILLTDDLQIIARSDEPLLCADESGAGDLVDINNENASDGPVAQVIFVTSALLESDRVRLYYGLADERIATTTLSLDAIFHQLKNVLS